MRITPKDRKIYNYIEKIGFATVKQIGRIFFNDITYKNELAKKRLNCLIEHGYIKETKCINCSQHIFYADDKFKKQTYHSILVLDLYSKFLEMKNLEVLFFKREVKFGNGKVIADGYLSVSYKDKIRFFLIEVQASNNSWKNSINKYANMEVLQDIINQSDGVFPSLIFVDQVNHKLDINIPFKVIQIDYNMTDFPFVFEE